MKNIISYSLLVLSIYIAILISTDAQAKWPLTGNNNTINKQPQACLKNNYATPAVKNKSGKPDINTGKQLSFIESKGQITDQHHNQRNDIQYSLAAANGLNIFIGNGAIHYQFSKCNNPEKLKTEMQEPSIKNLVNHCVEDVTYTMYRMDVELVGANKHAKIITEEKQDYYENYFTPGTGKNGVTAHAYNRITYKDVYPHIDWVLYTRTGELKHEFVVHTGGKVSDIKLQYGGATSLKVTTEGALIATTPQGTITEQAPYTYERDGAKVSSSFKLKDDVLSYETGEYSGKLVIDPSLDWATYYGGSDDEITNSISSDDSENVYVVGFTSSTSGIATMGAYQVTLVGTSDAFLAKFNIEGDPSWATYYGGSSGDNANCVSVDPIGNIYVTGGTASTSGIATASSHQSTLGGGIYNDAFLIKFNNNGIRQWGTYYGGSSPDEGYSLAIDRFGNIYMAGFTLSSSGIATSGAFKTIKGAQRESFLVRFDSSGVRQWATYYGGDNDDWGYSVAADDSGNVFMAGQTSSSIDIATTDGFQTTRNGIPVGFLVKFDSSGSRIWATYYGGNDIASISTVVTDDSSNVYITGIIRSTISIATSGAHQESYGGGLSDAFIAKFTSSGSRLWATYYGGNNSDRGTSVAVDASNNIILAGVSKSLSGIATIDAYQNTNAGNNDVFLVKFTSSGIRVWGSYFGGSENDGNVNYNYGPYLASDNLGNIYVSGNTQSTLGIATSGAYQTTYSGGLDVFLAKFNDCTLPSADTITGTVSVCTGSTTTLNDAAAGGIWSSSNPSIATVGSTGIVTGVSAGTTMISYTVTNGCGSASATKIVTVNPLPNAGTITGPSSVNTGSTITLSDSISGGTWSSSNSAIATLGSAGTVTGVAAGTATISYTVTNECGSTHATKEIAVNATDTVSCDAWAAVGNEGFSAGATEWTSLAIDGSGTPYVAYRDIANSSRATVMRYNGSSWITVGSAGFSVGTAYYTFLAIDGSGTPYVAYQDWGNSQKATVMKYNGSNWVVVGSAGFSAGTASSISLTIDTGGVPYVAYQDWGNSQKATVMKYNGSNWVTVGSAGFSAGAAPYTTLAIDGNGMPYVAYRDEANSGNATVMKYNGSSWITVGSAGFSTGGASDFSLAIDSSGTPYVAYHAGSPQATVMKYNGSNWITVGSAWVSANWVSFISLAIDGSGTPYVAYQDIFNSNKATVMKFDGSNWVAVGDVGVSAGAANYTSLAIDGTGTPHVAYLDGANSNRATVMKFASALTPIAGIATVCVSSSTALTNVTTGGIWSSGNTGIATVGSGTGIVIGVTAGTAVITYEISGGCIATKTITVYALTDAGAITGPSAVNTGATITLSNAVSGGTWSSSNTSIATAGSTGIVAGVAAGTVVISYTVTNSCGSARAIKLLTITDPGTCLSASNDTAICSGQSVNIRAIYSCHNYVSTGISDTGFTGTGIWAFPGDTLITLYSWTYLTPATMAYGADTDKRYGYIESTIRKTASFAGNTAGVAMDITPGQPGGYYLAINELAPDTIALHNGPNFLYPVIASAPAPGISLLAWNKLRLEVAPDGYVRGYLNDTLKITFNIPGGVPPSGRFGLTATNTSYEFRNTNQYYDDVSFLWSTGDPVAAINVSPTVTATYSCVVTAGSAVDTAGVAVTVTPLPNAGTLTGTANICLPGTTTLSTTGSGGTWSSDATGIATVGSTGIVTGISPGTATVSYAAINSCGSDYATKTVTVNSLNTGTITGPSIVNVGYTISLSDTVAGGTWSSSNTSVATIGSTGIVSGLGVGTSVISYTITNSCGTAAATKTITVNFLLTTPITGTLVFCAGSTSALSNATPGGAWSSDDTAVATVNAGTGLVTGVSAGTAVVSYTLYGVSVTAVVTVNESPGAIGGPAAICASAVVTLTCTPAGGTWSSTNSAVVSVGSATGVMTGGSDGIATISYMISNGCYSTLAVTSGALSPITGTLFVCLSTTSMLSHAVGGGTWVSSNPSAATIDGTTGLVTGVLVGVTHITYTYGVGCVKTTTVQVMNMNMDIVGSSVVCAATTSHLTSPSTGGFWTVDSTSIAVINSSTGVLLGVAPGTANITYKLGQCRTYRVATVNPLPDTIVAPTTILCASNSTTFTNASSGGTWASSAATRASVGSASGVVLGVSAGTATISYIIGSGCYSTKSVTVGAMPAAITGTMAMCEGSTTTLSTTTTGGTWSSGAAGTASIVSSAGTTALVSGVGAGIATISYNHTGGCVRTANVTVNAAVGAISGYASICVAGTTALSSATGGGTWSSSVTAKATVGSLSGIVTGVSTGTSNITYRTSATCFTTTQVTVNAATAIGGPAAACVGLTTALTHSTGGGSWSSSNSGLATVDATTGVVTGVSPGAVTITYWITPGCFALKSMVVHTLPATISGTPTVCAGSIRTLTSGGGSGTWSTSDSTVALVHPTLGQVSGVSAGTVTITYRATATTCYVTLLMTVTATPGAISGSTPVCSGSATTYTNSLAGGVWSSTAPSVMTIDSTTGNATAITGGGTTIRYTMPTGCMVVKPVTVNAMPLAISGALAICAGNTTTLTSPTTGATWTSTDSSIGTIIATTVTSCTVYGVNAGVATINYTNAGGCARSVTVTVNAALPANTGATVVCVGNTLALSNSAAGGTWASGTPAKATVGASTGIVAGVAIGTSNITYSIGAGCKSITQVSVIAATAAIAGATSVCVGQATTFTSADTGGSWSSASDSIAAVSSSGVVTGVAAGTTTVTYSVSTGCYKTKTITVKPVPSVSGMAYVTIGTPTTLTGSPTGGTWSSSATAIAMVGSATGTVSGISAGSVTITYSIASTGCYGTWDMSVSSLSSRPGIADNTSDANVGFSVYPNPSSGSLNISTTVSGEFVIYTIDGKQLQHYVLAAGTNNIQLPKDIADGVYTCRFIGADGSRQTVRLVYVR